LALALKTGHVSPKKMLGEMTVRELGLWAALWEIDPWSEERADYRAALPTYVLAEINRDPKKKTNAYKPTDFMPYTRKDENAKHRDVSARLRAALKGR
jgi:hypothetical protein